jgi:hypothetical protein
LLTPFRSEIYDREEVPPNDWLQPGSMIRVEVGPQLRYGEPDVLTPVDYGPDPGSKLSRPYFRKAPGLVIRGLPNITLRFYFSDGVAILNGSEIYRRNLASNASFLDMATADRPPLATVDQISGVLELLSGTNVFAIELHRFNSIGPSQSFDLQMNAKKGTTTVRLGGPPVRCRILVDCRRPH